MRYLVVLAMLVISTGSVLPQKIYCPKISTDDSLQWSSAMRELAIRALPYIHGPDPIDSLDDAFRLCLLAGESSRGLKYLDNLCRVAKNESGEESAIGFGYRVYALTSLSGATPTTFDSVYSAIFRERYASVNIDNKAGALRFFDAPVLDRNLAGCAPDDIRRTIINDSIQIKEAIKFCRTYLTFIVSSSTYRSARRIIQEIDDDTYDVTTHSISVSDSGTCTITVVKNKTISLPQPAILIYSIYPEQDMSMAKLCALRGYVGVIANSRGLRGSSGSVEPMEHEARDAYNIIEWIHRQPWCGDGIGMYGGSYLGFSQWAALKRPHPALKTIVPIVSVGAGTDFPVQNGVYMNYGLQWLRRVTERLDTTQGSRIFTGVDPDVSYKWYSAGTSYRSLDSLYGATHSVFQRWLEHPAYDLYWQSMVPYKEEYKNINIPILTITGYYDDDQLGAMYYMKQHTRLNPNANHTLLIGPFDHSGAMETPYSTFSNYTIDSIAMISITKVVFGWYDYILKNGPRPAILKDNVNFQMMGNNTWHSAVSLDKMADDTLALFPDFSKPVVSVRGTPRTTFSMTQQRSNSSSSFTQSTNLADRSDVETWRQNQVFGAYPLAIDTALHLPPDRIVLMSPELDSSVAISGGVSVSAVLRTNKKDLDVVMDVFELMPDGNFFVLCQNLQRASLARNPERRELLTPYAEHTVDISNTFLTCKRLQKGSRLVVALGPHKSPHWQINYGTGKDVSDETIRDAAEPLNIEWLSNTVVRIPLLRVSK